MSIYTESLLIKSFFIQNNIDLTRVEKKLTCNLHLHIGTDTKEVFDHTTARNGVYWVNHINLNLFCITYRFYIYLQGTMGAHNYTWHVFFTLVLIQ